MYVIPLCTNHRCYMVWGSKVMITFCECPAILITSGKGQLVKGAKSIEPRSSSNQASKPFKYKQCDWVGGYRIISLMLHIAGKRNEGTRHGVLCHIVLHCIVYQTDMFLMTRSVPQVWRYWPTWNIYITDRHTHTHTQIVILVLFFFSFFCKCWSNFPSLCLCSLNEKSSH